jgi:hypothetical protein
MAGAVVACVGAVVDKATVVALAVETAPATVAAAGLAAGVDAGWHAAAVNAMTSIRQTCHDCFLNIDAFLRGTIS